MAKATGAGGDMVVDLSNEADEPANAAEVPMELDDPPAAEENTVTDGNEDVTELIQEEEAEEERHDGSGQVGAFTLKAW